VDVLVRKTLAACAESGARTLVVCGGVACNSRLRHQLTVAAEGAGVPLLIAPPRYCTDNAAMIAGLAYHHLKLGERSDWHLDAVPRFGGITHIPFAPESTAMV